MSYLVKATLNFTIAEASNLGEPVPIDALSMLKSFDEWLRDNGPHWGSELAAKSRYFVKVLNAEAAPLRLYDEGPNLLVSYRARSRDLGALQVLGDW